MTFAHAFFDELQKIAKINDTASQKRLDRGGNLSVSTDGIHPGDMYGNSPLLPQREPSSTRPLEKRRRKTHPLV